MADDDPRSADDIAGDVRLTPTQRTVCRLWLALIDGIASETQLREAWGIAHSIQAIQARSAREHYQAGYQDGFEEGRDHAEKDQRQRFTEQDIARHLATMKPDRLH